MSSGIAITGHSRTGGAAVRQRIEGIQPIDIAGSRQRFTVAAQSKLGECHGSSRFPSNFSGKPLSWSSASKGGLDLLTNQRSTGIGRKSKNTGGSKGVRCRIIGEPAPMGQTSTYKDAWWELAIIHFIASKMGEAIGQTSKEKGYDAFVDISKRLVQGRSPLQQRLIVMNVLTSAVPSWVFKLSRRIFSKVTKFSTEYYALSTAIFFQWLVGPAEAMETEVNGVTQRSCVKIKKCRFLEASNCVGMCVNLCKLPSQDFISSSFGVPLYMKPNFEDMSCEMRYGEHPPPEKDDPALNQPCYAMLCKTPHRLLLLNFRMAYFMIQLSSRHNCAAKDRTLCTTFSGLKK